MIVSEAVANRATTELPEAERQSFFNYCASLNKTNGRAYVCWLFAVHYFYFGKPGINFLFWFTGGGLLIWWIVDIFRVPRMVKQANEHLPEVYLNRRISQYQYNQNRLLKQEQERQELLARFGDDETIERVTKKKQIRQGDPTDFLRVAYGRPLDIDTTVLKNKTKKTWKYSRNPKTKGYQLKFFVENGKVVDWEDKRQGIPYTPFTYPLTAEK